MKGMCLLVNGPAYMSIGKSIGLAYVKMMPQKKISFLFLILKKISFFISKIIGRVGKWNNDKYK